MHYREMEPTDERFVELVRYAFSPQQGPFDPDEFDPEDRPGPVGGQRGLFDGDEAVAVCAHYWFDVDVRGASVSAPGLSAVASPPERRRGGNVRRLLEESLAEYRDRGDPLSLLWPFSAPFYGQYGWATTNRYVVHDVDPGDLAFATGTDAAASVEFERVDADDWRDLHAVDRESWTHTLALDRSEDFWRHRVLESWGTDPYASVGYRDGDPVAYLTYTIEDGDDGRTLSASYFGAVDRDALLALLSFCHAHDSQVSTVRLKTPVDFDLAYRLDDPGAPDTDLRAGPMARVVDAVDALEAVPVQPDANADVVLDVADPLTDWHDDPVRLAAVDGDATAARAPDATPDVELDVGALAQLLLGTRTATDLARSRELTGRDGADPDAAAVRALDATYPETDACMLQFF
ncbi:GNAT family N-acetyltransferase [Halorubellus sp. PRR65]|uniref:GNAT family N-acetyltransferase n=1 Tax=Halorubellus sp. PRR65 TaxID=3098148 RepID=UPI002B257DF8|nr:GNAT family N-acetyltransferase [Halorubellus sp. PRR65]